MVTQDPRDGALSALYSLTDLWWQDVPRILGGCRVIRLHHADDRAALRIKSKVETQTEPAAHVEAPTTKAVLLGFGVTVEATGEATALRTLHEGHILASAANLRPKRIDLLKKATGRPCGQTE